MSRRALLRVLQRFFQEILVLRRVICNGVFEEMQRLVEKYEQMAELCGNCTQGKLYKLAASKYSERIGKLRRYVAEKELAIVGKEVAVC